MIKIYIEPAENGVVKTVQDDNINGAGEFFDSKKVYDLEDDNGRDYINTQAFLEDVIKDLGIDTGNTFSRDTLILDIDWGEKYQPNKEDIQTKIANLKLTIDMLKKLLKESDWRKQVTI